ncbi:MAG: GTP cyclohydrolase I FolE [Thermoplasmata archaeon]
MDGDALAKIEEHVGVILLLLGLDPGEEGLKHTPRRVARYLAEYRQPFSTSAVLAAPFSARGVHNMIIQHPIPFRMMCEHHLLPALGSASVGYVPRDLIVGLSKLPRLVEAVGLERPSMQEYICDRIAELLNQHIQPAGVIVVIKAEHSCMACRGVAVPGVITTTSSVKGIFRDVPAARQEFFSLIKGT